MAKVGPQTELRCLVVQRPFNKLRELLPSPYIIGRPLGWSHWCWPNRGKEAEGTLEQWNLIHRFQCNSRGTAPPCPAVTGQILNVCCGTVQFSALNR